jgi:AcrR family transcriptional regulator
VGTTRRPTRAEQSEDNRRRILEAARAVFVERGYHATTLDEIAEAAGFTKGALFSRFEGKADLFLALYQARIAERIDELGSLPRGRGHRTPEAITRQWLARLRGDEAWSLLVLEFRVAVAREPGPLARYRAIHERLVAAMAEIIGRDFAAAGLEGALTPAEAARAGMALANGLLLEQLASPDALPADLTLRASQALIAGSRRRPGAKT